MNFRPSPNAFGLGRVKLKNVRPCRPKKTRNGPLFLRRACFLGLRDDGNDEREEEEEEEDNDDYVPFEELNIFRCNLKNSHTL